MTETEKEESEFGSGLVVCLCKFSEHFMNDNIMRIQNRQYNDATDYIAKIPESQLIQLWANGATDHLYELRVPASLENTEIGRKVTELREKGLEMGHGFRHEKTYTIEDVDELRKLVTDIALLLDKHIGIKDGDWGQW